MTISQRGGLWRSRVLMTLPMTQIQPSCHGVSAATQVELPSEPRRRRQPRRPDAKPPGIQTLKDRAPAFDRAEIGEELAKLFADAFDVTRTLRGTSVRSLLRAQRGCARGGALVVVLAQVAGDAERSHQIALHHQRHAALDRDRAREREDAPVLRTLGEAVLKGIGRPFVERGGLR